MTKAHPQLKITTTTFKASADSGWVSCILMMPREARWLLVFAHGAGAGMRHPFMETMSRKLGDYGIGTFRYQFPYMEQKQKRPDPKSVLLATVQSAVNTARLRAETHYSVQAREHANGLPASEKAMRQAGIPLLAGGKSMGGRMTSMAAAEGLLPDVRGIVFFGFPLHPPNQPDKWTERAEHLKRVKVPMLFLQGSRDSFADLKLLRPVCKELGKRATLHLIDGADHSFHIPKSSGRTDMDLHDELARTVVEWSKKLESMTKKRNRRESK